jgi:hypothetical protein
MEAVMLMRLFGRRAPETRASGTGFTAQVMEARESFITGRQGIADLTAAAQGCVSLWEGGLAQAAVTGTTLLTPSALAMTARSLALRGEALFVIGNTTLIPATDWDVTTRGGIPTAYRITIPETGGGRSETVLAAEVLHLRIGTDPATPWAGSAPLRRSSLSAGLLHAVETALAEVFADAPLGSQVVPMPENPAVDNEALARSFRGRRGRVLLRDSVSVTAAGGPQPATDWRPSDLSPDLSRSMTTETLEAARGAILHAFGVLPALLSASVTGTTVREAQRHLAMWTLAPVAALIAEEASAKLGTEVVLDALSPLQAFDAGGRARAFKGMIDAMIAAKDAGLSDAQMQAVAAFAGTPARED